MSLDYNKGISGCFRCQKASKHLWGKKIIEIYATDGSFFFDVRMPIEQILMIILCWADQFSYEQTQKDA